MPSAIITISLQASSRTSTDVATFQNHQENDMYDSQNGRRCLPKQPLKIQRRKLW